MKKFMSWLSNSFAPKMNKFTANPWVSGISSSIMRLLPFILAGSLGFFYNVFKSYIHFLPDISNLISFSFGMLSLLLSFLVGYQCMEKLGRPNYKVTCGLTSLLVFIMMTMPGSDKSGNMVILSGRFGASAMIQAFIAGLFVSIIFHNYAKLRILENSTSIPDFVIGWINNIIPICFTILISSIIVFNLKIDVFNAIVFVFSPIASFGQTLPGFILICLIPAIFYSLGISSWMWNSVSTPIFMAGITANIAAVAAGKPAVNIVTSETVFTAALITMGGIGATLALNILMLRSKSKKLKTMGRVCIGPSIFNINEPIVFGAPIVLNPLLMLPMWINSITGPIVIWITMKAGLLNIPSKMIQVGQIPAPFSSVMITQDFRAIAVYVVLFIIYFFTWLPFFKVYEKQCMAEEMGTDAA